MRRTFLKRFFWFLLIAFAATQSLSVYVQSRQAEINAGYLIKSKIGDAIKQLAIAERNLDDLLVLSNSSVLLKARAICDIIAGDPQLINNPPALRSLLGRFKVDEINIIDKDGIITATTADFVGYDMNSRRQSSSFMRILREPDYELVQSPQPRGIDSGYYQYAGVPRKDQPGIIQVGYTATRIGEAIKIADIANFAETFRIGIGGSLLICENDFIIGSNEKSKIGQKLDSYNLTEDIFEHTESFTVRINDEKYLCDTEAYKNYRILGMLPYQEVYAGRNATVVFMILGNLILYCIMFLLVSQLLQKMVVDDIAKINTQLGSIARGNLNVAVNVHSNREFSALSDGINQMVASLKKAITEETRRIDAELEFARSIQLSSIPGIFPPYPNRRDFDLYGNMYTAKEVGGDFYDFYFVADNKLLLVIADVSGKGIGAALFMMTAKTMLKNLAESGLSPAEVFNRANRSLSINNATGTFVSAFMGVLDLTDGKFIYVNAGHNPPLIYDGAKKSHRYLTGKPNLVLAAMEDVTYHEHEITLQPSDRILFYTDGVIEAHDINGRLLGDARFQEIVEALVSHHCKLEHFLPRIKAKIDDFSRGAEVFDDIALLLVRYNGVSQQKKELELSSKVENLPRLLDFVSSRLNECHCPPNAKNPFLLAAEEVFVNISRHGYKQPGPVKIVFEFQPQLRQVCLDFIDEAKPYNPLEHADPDPRVAVNVETEPGGWGILIVKKSMDEVLYRQENGKNILTLKKALPEEAEPPQK